MKISEQNVRKLIRNEVRSLVTEIASNRQIFDAMDGLANQIESHQEEDDQTSPYETIAIGLIKYFENEEVTKALNIIGSAYDFEYDFSDIDSE